LQSWAIALQHGILSPDEVREEEGWNLGAREKPLAATAEGSSMSTGTVKWFNASKGFGFIKPDDGNRGLVRTLPRYSAWF
jgi:'Cold-shock' DNA-binding domain